ncbi:HD-GYP domain-containing protein [Chloroflexota bacterium]
MFSLLSRCHNLNLMIKEIVGSREQMLAVADSLTVGRLHEEPLWESLHGGRARHRFLTASVVDFPVRAGSEASWDIRVAYLLSMIKAEDQYTARHSLRVAESARTIGIELDLSPSEVESLRCGSLLHDVSAQSPGRLTLEEYRYIRRHAEFGAQMARPIVGDVVAEMIEHHHDYYGGSGHGQTAIGEGIPLGARIIAVADAFDAMVFDRPYRHATSWEIAGEEIRRCAYTQFDPEVVMAFSKVMQNNLPLIAVAA